MREAHLDHEVGPAGQEMGVRTAIEGIKRLLQCNRHRNRHFSQYTHRLPGLAWPAASDCGGVGEGELHHVDKTLIGDPKLGEHGKA